MRDAVLAIESALAELGEARNALPDDLAGPLEQLIAQTRELLDSLRSQEISASPAQGSRPEPD